MRESPFSALPPKKLGERHCVVLTRISATPRDGAIIFRDLVGKLDVLRIDRRRGLAGKERLHTGYVRIFDELDPAG